jgi:hypothetical protein
MERASRYVIAREGNVVHVEFVRDTRPPTPTFPGAGALRGSSSDVEFANSPAAGVEPRFPAECRLKLKTATTGNKLASGRRRQ